MYGVGTTVTSDRVQITLENKSPKEFIYSDVTESLVDDTRECLECIDENFDR